MTRIIIVEDDPMISEIYQKKFTEAGFDVMAATSGEQVLTMAKQNPVDVILLDLIMSKMSGFEVIEKMRKGNYDPNLKIIVSSNLSQNEDREKALNLGADGFVSKAEFTPGDLVKEVERLMNQFGEQKKNEARENAAQSDGSKSAEKSKASILMIEDEEIFIEMFGEKLKQEGYAVDFARNGAWGVKEAIKGNYDLYIMDMVMPAMTGEEMINRLKLEDKTKNVPIIMLSASMDDAGVDLEKKLGVQFFMRKTKITPSELVRAVDEVLSGK